MFKGTVATEAEKERNLECNQDHPHLAADINADIEVLADRARRSAAAPLRSPRRVHQHRRQLPRPTQ